MGNYSFWLLLIAASTFILNVLIGLFNFFAHQKIVKNDLFHMSADIKNISTKQDNIEKSVSELASSVSYVKGQIDMSLVTIKRKNLKKNKV